MGSHALSRSTAVLCLACGFAGCATNVARVDRGWSRGALQVDPDQPVVVETRSDDSVTVSLPFLADVDENRFVGQCTGRAVWIDADTLKQEIRGASELELLGLLDSGRLSYSPVVIDTATFEPGARRSGRVVVTAELTRDEPTGRVNSVGEVDSGLLLDLWLGDANDVRCVDIPSPPPRGDQLNVFLIDFDMARPVERSLSGGGALAIVIIALSGIFAIGVW